MHLYFGLGYLLAAACHALTPEVEAFFEGTKTMAAVAPGPNDKTTTSIVAIDPTHRVRPTTLTGIHEGASTHHLGSGCLGDGSAGSGASAAVTLSTVCNGGADTIGNLNDTAPCAGRATTTT